MRPRRMRYQRDPFGRIVAIRSASDPYWDTEWMWRPSIRAYLEALDRAVRRADWSAAGFDPDEMEAHEQRRQDALRGRLRGRFR